MKKKIKKHLQSRKECCKMGIVVTLIAMKHEVAVFLLYIIEGKQVFLWSECQVRKLATSHCTIRYSAKRFIASAGEVIVRHELCRQV